MYHVAVYQLHVVIRVLTTFVWLSNAICLIVLLFVPDVSVAFCLTVVRSEGSVVNSSNVSEPRSERVTSSGNQKRKQQDKKRF